MERVLMGMLLVATPLFVMAALIDLGVTDREAAVVFDVSCHVVHVPFTPWKEYLDINAFGRAARLARIWFKV